MAKFTVDTHLFRELGELLVGRDSTALIELIKNSYDADATEVTVHGQQLDRPEQARILVSDNGTGMTSAEFTDGFLRVASRLKEQGERRSSIFRRRYTGSKGIGRLAAHKLARRLEIDSVSRDLKDQQREALHAVIDWDEIERCETLDDLDATSAIVMETREARRKARRGTTLLLTNLRRPWTPTERARFFAEVQSFDPPAFLRKPLSPKILREQLLFDTPVVRDEQTEGKPPDADFQVRLEGDFAAGDEYWELFAQVANWVLEIRAAPDSDKVRFAIAPTRKTRRDNREAREFKTSIPHPDPARGPFFEARILVREGLFGGRRDQQVWAARTSGIRVYLEGFRVLPYGEPKDDWLSIDHDYTRRPRQLEMLKEFGFDVEGADPDEGLIRLPHNNYFGAVFLTQERAPTLRILVNREGFVPEAGFDALVKLVRTGVDLCTRVRAAAGYARRQKWREDRGGRRRPATDREPVPENMGMTEDKGPARIGALNRLREGAELFQKARSQMRAGNVQAALDSFKSGAQQVEEATEDAISEAALLRVLASVGTQMAAFVHEINALLGTAQTIEQALGRTMEDASLSRQDRGRLRQIQLAATDLKHGLERHASYLIDVVTPDARRRRARQRFADCFDAAVRLVQHQAERRAIDIENEIPPDLKSPPMFRAELTAVFANLLTNAVKAAGKNGGIRAEASDDDEKVVVRIQNTGAVIDLGEAERWFRPFESTTLELDPVLGQGMGLGLTITQSVLESYGATARFVQPSDGFSTAVEIAFPK